ncbi:MAG: GNAT family N-acetyltransferase, partial [Ilumatobacteraceae bacterium]
MATFTFRRLTRADFPMLAGWLAEPHVARWWNHEFSAEAVERDFGPTADGVEPSEDHLVLLDGQPIGLIQYSLYAAYPEYVDELTPLLPVPDHAVTIDYLIGDPALTGRGVGTAMIGCFVERIWR